MAQMQPCHRPASASCPTALLLQTAADSSHDGDGGASPAVLGAEFRASSRLDYSYQPYLPPSAFCDPSQVTGVASK